MRIVVLDGKTMGFKPVDWEPLHELGEVTYYDLTPYEAGEIVERIADHEVVVCNKVPLTKAVIDSCPNLKLITLVATGTNNVDLAAVREKGITVCNVPGYSTPSVAQHTFALILELSNRVGAYDQSVQKGDWVHSDTFCYWNHEMPDLENRTIGIIGFGEIGRKVGAIANAFGMKVMASMRTPRDAPDWNGFSFASNEEIFAQADVVSLHCPQTEENTGFVNAELLKTCQSHTLLINTGRGGLIVEEDLAEAVKKGWIGGAAVDVVSKEPMASDCPLKGIENLIITPHLAWASRESRLRLFGTTLENIKTFQSGSPQNVVN